MVRRQFLVFFCALFPFTLLAQGSPDATQRGPSAAEIQQRHDAGLALLKEAISTSKELTQPANRIYIEASCVQLLWDTDEALARSLVKSLEQRYRDLNQQTVTMNRNQRGFMQQVYGMRGQVVSAVAPHDAELALEFLRNTRAPDFGNRNQEADLELSLASQAARQNAKLAADLVRNAAGTNSGMVVNALDSLYQADPAAATQAATDVMRRLTNANLSDRQNFYAATQLLQMYGNRTHEVNNKNGGVFVFGRGARSSVVTQAMLQPLAQAIISASQKPDFPADLQMQLQNMGSTFEKFSPGVGATWKAAQKNGAAASPNDFWQQLNDVTQHGTEQQAMEFAAKAPEGLRLNAYEQVANKLTNDGNTTAAMELIEGANLEPEQQQQLTRNVNHNAAYQAANKGAIEQARAAAARVDDTNDRVNVLIAIANQAENKQQPEIASDILEEARGLMPRTPTDLQELNMLAQIAQAYVQAQPARAIEIIEPIIATVNQKLPALQAVDGFSYSWPRSFAGGEMLMQMGAGAEMLRGINNTLASVAVKDPELAAKVAAEVQRPEARTMVLIEMARRLLMEGGGARQIRAGVAGGTIGSFVQ